MNNRYINPETSVIIIDQEGILCSSTSEQMQLPDVTWKDETEW